METVRWFSISIVVKEKRTRCIGVGDGEGGGGGSVHEQPKVKGTGSALQRTPQPWSIYDIGMYFMKTLNWFLSEDAS